MAKLTLASQSAQLKSVRASAEKLVNMYAVPFGTDSQQSSVGLYNTPGLSLFVDLSGNEIRQGGMIEYLGGIYVIKDNTLYCITYVDNVINTAVIGTLQSSSGPVCIAATFEQIMIVDGTFGYLFTNATSSFTTITDTNFTTILAGCSMIRAQDDFFMALQPNTDTWWLSSGGNGAVWPALRFASTNAKYNNLVSMLPMFGEFWLFCTQSTEIWFDSGAATFPYTPEGGAFLNYGCNAPHTVLRSNTGAIWLGTGGVSGSGLVLAGPNATSITVISTQAMHDQFSKYTNLNDAFAFIYQLDGMEFYILTFPTDAHTWQYCFNTGMWNELTSQNPLVVSPAGEPAFTRWRPNAYAYFQVNNGVHLVGDYASGKIFQLDPYTYTEDTTNWIQRIIVPPTIEIGSQYITIDSIELLTEPGQATASGQGSNPLICMEVSRDGGFTWGNKRYIPVGAIGTYNQRVRWTMLGCGRHMTLRFTMSEPIKFIVTGGEYFFSTEGLSAPFPRYVQSGSE